MWENDEFATWVRSFGRYSKSGGADQMKSRILGMYDGQPMRIDRVKNRGIVENIPEAWLSVFGTVQPSVLARLLTVEDFESGFFNVS